MKAATRTNFVAFDLNVPMSASGEYGGIPKSKSTTNSFKPDVSPSRIVRHILTRKHCSRTIAFETRVLEQRNSPVAREISKWPQGSSGSFFPLANLRGANFGFAVLDDFLMAKPCTFQSSAKSANCHFDERPIIPLIDENCGSSYRVDRHLAH